MAAPAPAQPRLRVSGVLAQSESGTLALLDAPLPAGYHPLAQAAVRLVGSDLQAQSGPDGSLDLPSPEARPRLLVSLPGAPPQVVEAAAFSSAAGEPVRLQHVPRGLHLRQGEPGATRVVGVDARGRFLAVDPARLQLSRRASAPSGQAFPTSILAGGAVLRAWLGQSGPALPSAGTSELKALYGSLAASAEVASFSPACQAMLAGRVTRNGQPVAGAVVQVEGFPSCVRTDETGSYAFKDLPPLPSQVHVFEDGRQVALGFAPLTSRMLTQLDLPARPRAFEKGPALSVAGATALASRPNGEIFVCDGSTLREFTPQGASRPTPSGTLQAPAAVASDFNGECYVGDGALDTVQNLDAGFSTPVAQPSALALDGGANIYVASRAQKGIGLLANTGRKTWAAETLVATEWIGQPGGLAVQRDGQIFVADTANDRIAVLELLQGDPAVVIRGNPDPSKPLRAQLVGHWPVKAPLGVALGPAGEVYVASAAGVVCSDPQGRDAVTVSAEAALGPIAVDRWGRVWVAQPSRVQAYLPATPDVLAPASPPPAGESLVDKDQSDALDSAMLQEMRNFELPGVSLAISVNGRLVLGKGYGYGTLSLQEQSPTQPGQLFRLASCSKTFTGLATLLLMQEYPQTLSLGTRVLQPGGLLAGQVPGYDLSQSGFASPGMAEIELSQLLDMTAGLDSPDALYGQEARSLGGDSPPATALQTLLFILSKRPLSNPPGTRYVYSDVAYMTLGRVVEAVARLQALGSQTYGEFCRQSVMPSLGISDMRIADTRLGGRAGGEVSYYPFSGQSCGPSIFSLTPQQVPATYGASYDGLSHDSTGGWIASATDLLRIANSLAPGGAPPGFSNPLDIARQSILYSPPSFPGADELNFFSCGWSFTADAQGRILSMAKDGALPGTMSWVKLLRQGTDQVTYAFLVNSRPGPGMKKSGDAVASLRTAVEAFVANQAGRWPADGDLFRGEGAGLAKPEALPTAPVRRELDVW
jgi:N-acyl-D-amino-acid deacylase